MLLFLAIRQTGPDNLKRQRILLFRLVKPELTGHEQIWEGSLSLELNNKKKVWALKDCKEEDL